MGQKKPGDFTQEALDHKLDPVAYVEHLLDKWGTLAEAARQTNYSRQTFYYIIRSNGREIVRPPKIRRKKKQS